MTSYFDPWGTAYANVTFQQNVISNIVMSGDCVALGLYVLIYFTNTFYLSGPSMQAWILTVGHLTPQTVMRVEFHPASNMAEHGKWRVYGMPIDNIELV